MEHSCQRILDTQEQTLKQLLQQRQHAGKVISLANSSQTLETMQRMVAQLRQDFQATHATLKQIRKLTFLGPSLPANLLLLPLLPVSQRPDSIDDALEQSCIAAYQASLEQAEKEKKLAEEKRKAFSSSMVPTLAPIGSNSSSFVTSSPPVSTSAQQQQQQQKLNYLEFEHGLAPPDPWDTASSISQDLMLLNVHAKVNSSASNNDKPPPLPARRSDSSPSQSPLSMPQSQQLPASLSRPLAVPPRPATTSLANPIDTKIFNYLTSCGMKPPSITHGLKLYSPNQDLVAEYCLTREKLCHRFEDRDIQYSFDCLLSHFKKADMIAPAHPVVLAFISSFVRLREFGYDEALVVSCLMQTMPPLSTGSFDDWADAAVAKLLH